MKNLITITICALITIYSLFAVYEKGRVLGEETSRIQMAAIVDSSLGYRCAVDAAYISKVQPDLSMKIYFSCLEKNSHIMPEVRQALDIDKENPINSINEVFNKNLRNWKREI